MTKPAAAPPSLDAPAEQINSSTTRGEPRRVNDENHRRASDPPLAGEEAERLLGIIAALRCTENIFEPLPARKKHDAIFKQHDEFLLSFIERYPNHFDKYVWEHIQPPAAL